MYSVSIMRSQWYEYKEAAIALRRTGMSMTLIEQKLGIPRSTLSGWFKNVLLTEAQRTKLMNNSRDGWQKARENAVKAHNQAKADRLARAKLSAEETLSKIDISNEVMDLAFAMLYLGEGAKNGTTSIANSDSKVLKFVIKVLEINYGVLPIDIKCDLHLRADQDPETIKKYWAQELGIPLQNFRKAYLDQRTVGRSTYEHYKGVCVLYCGSIAIQRKLVYLYNLFCKRITELDGGA